LREIDRIMGEIERLVKTVPGVTSALAERLNGGRYVDIRIDRDAAARYGMNIADVQSIVASAIGDNVGETVEGLQRFPINVRYPRELRGAPMAGGLIAAPLLSMFVVPAVYLLLRRSR
jgi:Cu(I)/Ag(I) efflux system membrane protein CusA/SilA